MFKENLIKNFSFQHNKKNLINEELKLLDTAQRIINEDGDLTLMTNEFDERLLKNSGLLITKPKLYVCNVDEESIKSGNKLSLIHI